MDISLVTPIYNEEQCIKEVVLGWYENLKSSPYNFEIILSNDGSTDSSLEIIQCLSNEFTEINYTSSNVNQGYGSAMRNGIAKTRGHWVATIDSDGQFEIEDIITAFSEVQSLNIDAYLGYRRKKKDSFIKYFLNLCLDKFFNILFMVKVNDPNCAIRIVKKKMLNSFELSSKGFTFPTELVIKIIRSQGRYKLFPVNHYPRKKGESKLRVIQTSINFLVFLFRQRFKKVTQSF